MHPLRALRRGSAASAAASLLGAPVARAAVPPATAPVTPAPPTEQLAIATDATGARQHTGFYLRLAIGFSGFNDLLLAKSTSSQPSERIAVSGIGTASEVAIGGAVGRGVVLGGGLYNVGVLASSYTIEKGNALPPNLARPGNFTLLGFFADWYFDPRRGLHGQAAIGAVALTRFQPDASRYDDSSVAWGGGLMLGIGNEWWIEDRWSLGLLARVTAGVATEREDGRRWVHLISATPALMFSVTYQ